MKEKTGPQKARGFGDLISPLCVVMRPVGWIVLCLAAMLWFALPGVAGADEVKCIECHSGDPIDPDRYANSAHKDMSCTDCHQKGFNKHPHTGKTAEAESCMDCHEGSTAWDEAAQGTKASVHADMLSCANCHDPHHLLPPNLVLNPSEGLAALNRSCLQCHAAGDTPADNRAAFAELIVKHEQLSQAAIHLQRVACVVCHTPPTETSIHNILPKSEAINDCDKCHTRESILVTKLDSFLAGKEGAERGWINAALYNSGAYVIGATRNQWLDWGVLLILAMTLGGVGAHALLRWFFGYIRRTS